MNQNNKQEKWEKEFNKKFVRTPKNWDGKKFSLIILDGDEVDEIKQFIKATLIKEYRKGYNACLRENGFNGERYMNKYL